MIEKDRSINKDLAIIVPAFNEEKVVYETLSSIPRSFDGIARLAILVVDDGSADSTLNEAMRHSDVTVVRHMVNRGLGGALMTGIQWARNWGADIAVTFDADGQLSSADISRIIKPLLDEEADVVLGSRLIDTDGMPWYRIFGNWGLNIITYMLFGVWTTDSQSGLRAFSKVAIDNIQLVSNRMEVSSEIIGEIGRNKFQLAEIPITCAYTDYSLAKGQSNLNGFNIVFNLIFRKVSGSK